jgi:hypothetical protein
VRLNQTPLHGALRLFRVVDDSMRPALRPGDGLVALRGGAVRTGQLRVFPDPRRSTRWLIKRVGEVYRGDAGTIFEATSSAGSRRPARTASCGPCARNPLISSLVHLSAS